MLQAARLFKNRGVRVAITSFRGLQKKLLPFTLPTRYPFALLYSTRDTLLKSTADPEELRGFAAELANNNNNNNTNNNNTNVLNTSRIASEVYTVVQSRTPRSAHRRKMILLVRGVVGARSRSLAAFRRLIRLAKRRRKAALATAEVSPIETPASLQSTVRRLGGRPFVVILDLQQITVHDYVPHFQGIYETARSLANLRYHFVRTRV